ncbi:ribosomal protection-like ABC-F family protein [Marinicrinis sediminis]|uniref:Ribosomal protection-like ABC-F family protein n=1 Tax=Marinicrinis sediminis TaxID=1652465 RepID=A0ABW5R5X5_9BACL
MYAIQGQSLQIDIEGMECLKQVQIEVKEGEKVALIGRNGVGKTTLLQVLLGRRAAEEGYVHRAVPLEEWGSVEQHWTAMEQQTVLDAVKNARPELKLLQQQLNDWQNGMDGYIDRQQQYMELGGYDWELAVEKALVQVGLTSDHWNRKLAQLSGGQKTKVQLATLLVRKPKVMIMDEPTNHLDQETVEWLQDWMKRYEGTILYVSHDRALIEATADAVIELTREGTNRTEGGYTKYLAQKEAARKRQAALYKQQQGERQQLLDSIRRYQQWFQSAEANAGRNSEVRITKSYYAAKAKKNVARFHAKQKELERLEHKRVEKPQEHAEIQVRWKDEELKSKALIRMEDMSFAYPQAEPDAPRLLQGVHLTITPQDRLAITGPNGSGKSTLLKLMTGELSPTTGKVIRHPRCQIGYFSQELERLDPEETLLDSLLKLPNMTQTEARTILGCFLFPRDAVYKQIGDLSMGEKCRAAFLRLYYSGAHLLVLDEPTNYLDMETRERMETAFSSFPGAVVFVTHDRYMRDKLGKRRVQIENGQVLLRSLDPEDDKSESDYTEVLQQLEELSVMGQTGKEDICIETLVKNEQKGRK